jgi:mannose-6-phosphate isomerase-like protein (cupin superfamily)
MVRGRHDRPTDDEDVPASVRFDDAGHAGQRWARQPSHPFSLIEVDRMQHFTIARVAQQSADFRRVLWTGEHTQLVVMTIPPGEDIGLETHEHNDQILSFVAGAAEATVGGETKVVGPGDLVVVPARTEHNFRNTGPDPLVLYTVYGPPDHADGVVHHTKAEAEAAEAAGEDEPPAS